MVKNLPAYQCKRRKRSGFDLWVRKILRRRKWQPTPIFLRRNFQGQRGLVGYSPWALKESDTAEKLNTSISIWTLKFIFSESFGWSQRVIRALFLKHLKRESVFLLVQLNYSFQDLRFTGYFCGGLRKGEKKTYPVFPVPFPSFPFPVKTWFACLEWAVGGGGWERDILFEAQLKSQVWVRTASSPPNHDLRYTASHPPLPSHPTNPPPAHLTVSVVYLFWPKMDPNRARGWREKDKQEMLPPWP